MSGRCCVVVDDAGRVIGYGRGDAGDREVFTRLVDARARRDAALAGRLAEELRGGGR